MEIPILCPECGIDALHHDYIKVHNNEIDNKTTSTRFMYVSDYCNITIGFTCVFCKSELEMNIKNEGNGDRFVMYTVTRGSLIEKLR